MVSLPMFRTLWDHAAWADGLVLEALRASRGHPPEALREYAHVLGAEEVWLARIQGREPRAAVWPEASFAEVEALAEESRAAYGEDVAALDAGDLESPVTYTNSAGAEFTNTVAEILLHVTLHGQYHRGKVNVLLRRAGHEPAPVDLIAFVRGAPAATEATARRPGRVPRPTGGTRR